MLSRPSELLRDFTFVLKTLDIQDGLDVVVLLSSLSLGVLPRWKVRRWCDEQYDHYPEESSKR